MARHKTVLIWSGVTVCSLALAGLLLWQGGSQRKVVPLTPRLTQLLASLPDTVATVNGRVIVREAVERSLRGVAEPGPDDLRETVRRLIDHTLLDEAMSSVRNRDAISFTENPEETLIGLVEIPREEVLRYWSRHPGVFTGDFYGVRRMTAGSKEEARSMLASLNAGTTPGVAEPVRLEWVGPGEVDADIEEAIAALRPGEAIGPLALGDRYQVVQLVARRRAGDVSFEDWEPRLRRYLQAERWRRERLRWLRLREAYAQVKVTPGVGFVSTATALDFFRSHPDIVGVANDIPITWGRLQERVIQRRRMAGKSDARPIAARELRPVLDKLIEHTLIREEARKLGVAVQESEVEERYRSLRSGFASDEEVEAMLQANATSLDAWRRDTRYGLLLLKTEEAMSHRIAVTPEEIHNYWEHNQSAFSGPKPEDHRDHIATIIRKTRWLNGERVRWVLSLMERGTIWNRLDLTLRLREPVLPLLRARMGSSAGVIVVAREWSCRAGLCKTVGQDWQGRIPLHVVTGELAVQVVDTWMLPSLPWAFAVDAQGRVLAEYPGPLTDQALFRLAHVLEQPTEPSEVASDR